MCTFEYPFGNPYEQIENKTNQQVIEEYKFWVLNQKEPDFSKIPKEYSSKTVEIIKLFLTYERKDRKLIKDVI